MKRRQLSLLLAALATVVAVPGQAEDTEVFMTQYTASGASSGRPKVLILFDNSGSMRDGVPQAKADFNPAIDWTERDGAPDNFRNDRIYWSEDGNPPGENTDRYVPASSNRCNTSLSPLYSTGRYTDYLRVWRDDYRIIDTEGTEQCDWRWGWYYDRRWRYGWYYECWEEERDIYGHVDVWRTVADNDDTRQTAHLECAADIDNNDPTNPGLADGWACDEDGPFCPSGPGDPWEDEWDRHDNDLTRTLFTGNYLAWYYNDRLIEDRTKMEIAQDVISDLVLNNPQIDFGLMLFNWNDGNSSNNKNGGRVVSHMSRMSDTDRSDFVSLVQSLSPETWTPLCETYYEAYRYLAKPNGNPLNVYYGDDDVNRQPYRDPCSESDDGAGHCAKDGTYNSPMGDCEQIYLILMTDGRPTYDLHANTSIKALPGVGRCNNYMTDHNNDFQENCLPELARYMYENDLDDQWQNGDQRVVTYTIGFLTDQVLLSEAAEKGGGTYYTAEDAHTLADAFQATLTEILSSNTTFAAPAVAVDAFNRTRSLSDMFIAMFRPEIRPRWRGNLKKLEINDDGEVLDANGVRAIDPVSGRIKDTATTFWTTGGIDGMEVDEGGAGQRLTARNASTRVIKTNTGTNSALENFDTSNTNLTPAMLSALDTEQRDRYINWSRGVDVLDEDEDGDTTDTRPWIMGDVMHSRPLAINYGNPGDASDPDVRIVFGTNAGFLHMVDSTDGEESWAFFPKELGPIPKILMANSSENDHPYGVDGSPEVFLRDVNKDGNIVRTDADGDLAYLFFGLRRGGQSYYALDITDPDSPSSLWHVDWQTLPELGQSWSTPKATFVPGHDNPVVIFGAGYDVNKDSEGVGSADTAGRGIYIVDAVDGSLVWGITPAESSDTNLQETGLVDSVPAEVSVIDSNGDRLTDRIYFPDTGGNIWRADLVGTDRTQWTVYKLAALGDNTETDDRRFMDHIDVAITRYGDLAYDALMIGSGNRAHPLERDVVDRFYMIRDFETLSARHVPNDGSPATDACANEAVNPDGLPCAEAPPVIVEANLFNATSNLIQDGNDEERAAAQAALASSATKGWYITLEATGEKSLSRAITLQGIVFFTTYVPPDPLDPDVEHICRPSEGSGFLYAVDLHDASARYDWSAVSEGDALHKVDRSKKIKDNIPDYPVAHFGDPEIRLVGVGAGTGGKGSEDTGLSLTTQAIYWFEDAD